MTQLKLIPSVLGSAVVLIGTIGHTTAASAMNFVRTGGGYEAAVVRGRFNDISNDADAVRILQGADDASAQTTPLDFDFDFFGTNYRGQAVNVSSNGLLSFVGSNISPVNRNLETNSLGSSNFPTIATLWKDLSFAPSRSDAAYYKLAGPAGRRQLTVQWNRAVSNGTTATFQTVLREFDNAVYMNYQPPALSLASNATIGIRGTNGNANGRRLQWSYNTPFSAYETPQTVRFRPDTLRIPGGSSTRRRLFPGDPGYPGG